MTDHQVPEVPDRSSVHSPEAHHCPARRAGLLLQHPSPWVRPDLQGRQRRDRRQERCLHLPARGPLGWTLQPEGQLRPGDARAEVHACGFREQGWAATQVRRHPQAEQQQQQPLNSCFKIMWQSGTICIYLILIEIQLKNENVRY